MNQTQTIAISLAVLLLVIVISAIIDTNIRKRHGISKAQHIKRAIGRSLFMGVQAWAVFQPQLNLVIWFFIFQAALWWILFDMLMNIYNADALFKVGNTAFLDRIWHIMTRTKKEYYHLDGFTYHPERAAGMQMLTKISILVTAGIVLSNLL